MAFLSVIFMKACKCHFRHEFSEEFGDEVRVMESHGNNFRHKFGGNIRGNIRILLRNFA